MRKLQNQQKLSLNLRLEPWAVAEKGVFIARDAFAPGGFCLSRSLIEPAGPSPFPATSLP
jgi:hypothetical protein